MRLGEVSVSKLGLLGLIVPILLTTHEAQAAYPDYVVACADLLESLRTNDSVQVPADESRRIPSNEILASKDLARWMQRNGGRLHRMNADVAGSQLFRWVPPSGESRVVKAYFDERGAIRGDRQLKFLGHNLPVGFLEILPRTGKYRSLRFYKDVRGVTLKHLIAGKYYPDEVNEEIKRLYAEHLRAFKERILERYGEKNVKEINEDSNATIPSLHLEIASQSGHTIDIWIHGENVLFDSTTKGFWLIDP
jgi:hypothetical protein